jgi:hypothetical protein
LLPPRKWPGAPASGRHNTKLEDRGNRVKIITADERLAEKSGAKILIVGPAKVGKTSLLRTVDPERTLFIDLEAGDLAVKDVPVDTLRPETWEQCRDLACFLTGPNPSLPPTVCYSQARHSFRPWNTGVRTSPASAGHRGQAPLACD